MGFDNYISEQEACSLTGMSQATLLRFAEAGYLKIENDNDGLKLYSRTELSSLFGIQPSNTSACAATTRLVNQVTGSQLGQELAANENQTKPLKSEIETFTIPNQIEQTSDREISQLKNIINLQEKILDIKDQEILDLKSQREWLRARVEKLEDKSDRDQVLLLTEAQTLKNLINMNQKRSPVRHALEWLGFAEQKNNM